MRTNEAREITAEDHSLSRFMGSKRAMGDDIEQLADLVYTDKRKQLCNSVRKNKIVEYLNLDPSTQTARNKCRALGCHCLNGKRKPCCCNCKSQSGNTKLAKDCTVNE